jgi:hypothetical protein
VVFCYATAVPAFSLPAERHYELVSPVFKDGFAVKEIEAVAPNGESVAYFSEGSFAGAPSGPKFGGVGNYLARRGASEWSTTPLMTPAILIAQVQSGDMSPSLNEVMQMGRPGPHYFKPPSQQDLFLHSTDSPDTQPNWELGGTVEPLLNQENEFLPTYISSSVGFCQMLLATTGGEALVPEAVNAAGQQLYDVDRGCNGEAESVAPVGLNNKDKLIDPACDTGIGGEKYLISGNGKSSFNAVSSDGKEIFFTTCTVPTGESEYQVPHQIYMRLAGSKTVEVSKPLGSCTGEMSPHVAGEVPCENATTRASAEFAGASEDGSRVYFTAPLASKEAPLVPGDEDASNNLYVATIGCPQARPGCGAAEREVTGLDEVSHDPNSGQAANVMGVVRVAPDGTRTYFVAGGDMLTTAQQDALESEGRPVPQVGAPNLYMYDSSSATSSATNTFIGVLSGADERLWTYNEGEAQTAGTDGRFLVFATYAQLLPSDTNVGQDVYRYDAQSGRLVRVSGGEDGADDNGNGSGNVLGAKIAPGHDGGSLREQHEMNNRAISEDGSRIAFTSAEPLSPSASNGLANAYEWRENPGGVGEGSVSLISSGDSEGPVTDVVISATGNDIFFETTQGLVPQDVDNVADVYDARAGENFPQAAAPVQPCSGDACQGPLTNPAPLLVPGSVSQAAGDNFSAPKPITKPKAKQKTAKCKKGYARKNGKCVKQKAKKKAKKANSRGGK